MIVQVLPLTIRRLFYSKKTAKINQPEVLTVDGVMKYNQYERQLHRGQVPPTLRLASHPFVPITQSGLVDVPALLKMNQRIAAKEIKVRINRGAPTCCACSEELDADLDTQELFVMDRTDSLEQEHD